VSGYFWRSFLSGLRVRAAGHPGGRDDTARLRCQPLLDRADAIEHARHQIRT
jgi:hypothetical protein